MKIKFNPADIKKAIDLDQGTVFVGQYSGGKSVYMRLDKDVVDLVHGFVISAVAVEVKSVHHDAELLLGRPE